MADLAEALNAPTRLSWQTHNPVVQSCSDSRLAANVAASVESSASDLEIMEDAMHGDLR